jgi:outer membrane lipoprotein carrier protein
MRLHEPFFAVMTALALSLLPIAERPAEAQAPAAAAPVPGVTDVVNQVQGVYDNARSFQSDFRQEFVVKAYNQTKSSHGHVIFARPGKMSWSYDNPAGNRVVSDGSTLRVYTAADRQMYESAVNGSQDPAAVSFLTGQGKLTESFNLQLIDGNAGPQGTGLSFPGGWILIGVPKVPTPSYQKVLFYADKAKGQVRRVLIIDGQGNVNTFRFENPRLNDPVDSAQFVLTPPPGISIVRL